jgi:hypothetical protein
MGFEKFDHSSIFLSENFKTQVAHIRHIAELRLTEAIWNNVYVAHKTTYPRTYELLESVSSEVVFENDHVTIRVFCDSSKMTHTSEVDDKPTYIPALINTGFYWSGWETQYPPDYFHNRPPSYFLETAMEQVQRDMQEMFLDAVVMAFNSNKYRDKHF